MMGYTIQTHSTWPLLQFVTFFTVQTISFLNLTSAISLQWPYDHSTTVCYWQSCSSSIFHHILVVPIYAVFIWQHCNMVYITICFEAPINWEAFVIRSLNLSGKLLSHLFCHLTDPPSYYMSLKTHENTLSANQCQHHDQSRRGLHYVIKFFPYRLFPIWSKLLHNCHRVWKKV